MSVYLILLIVILSPTAVVYIIGAEIMCKNISIPRYKTYEETILRAKEEENSYRDFDSFEKESFTLPLRDGYEISGDIFPLNPRKVVIISHGHGDNKYTGIRFLQVFRDLGYTAVIYDLRGHGNNRRTPCTMGLNESKDLAELIEFIRGRFPDAVIGLHGLSMGAATTAITLGYHPNAAFAVCDCGYGSLKQLCMEILEAGYHLPSFLIGPVSIWNRLRFGYRLEDIDPARALLGNEIPVCFIHGADDDFVPCTHSKAMYEQNKGYKELHLIEGAAHAQAWIRSPEGYEKIIRDFLTRITQKDK